MSRVLLSKALIFTVGAALGSLVTWKLVEAKYKQIADEEIASVKEAYTKSESKNLIPEGLEKGMKSEDLELVEACSDLARKLNYTSFADVPKSVDRPYVIKPEEYGDLEDYEQIELLYYADGVLVDDMDEPVEDVDNVVGLDSLKTFGMYEDDAVHVRNDTRKCDYEILRSEQEYSELDREPHPREG